MNNERTRATMMLLAGGYIIYTGVTLFQDVWKDRPENFIMFAVISVVFIVIGGWVIISKIKALSKIQQEEIRLAQEEYEKEEAAEKAASAENDEQDSLNETNEDSVQEDTDTDAFEREVERMLDERQEDK